MDLEALLYDDYWIGQPYVRLNPIVVHAGIAGHGKRFPRTIVRTINIKVPDDQWLCYEPCRRSALISRGQAFRQHRGAESITTAHLH